MKFLFSLFFLIQAIPSLQAHDHHHTKIVYQNNYNVNVADHSHHGHWHERVYVNDPWYHDDHVYIYNGDPYANWYGGYPYYYYDPRFYYSSPGVNIQLNLGN
jgi:hypothetical protein